MRQQFPDLAERVTAVVLSAVILFKIIGPILVRGALMRAGEATADPLMRQESVAL